jgi:hypothetical protein
MVFPKNPDIHCSLHDIWGKLKLKPYEVYSLHEKYHRTVSSWIEILLEDQSLSGSPGVCGQFETVRGTGGTKNKNKFFHHTCGSVVS